MQECVAKEVQSLSPQFPTWDDVMRRYDERLHDDSDDVSDQDVSTVGEVHKIFETVLRVCTRCGGFRDAWDFPAKFCLMPFGQETVVNSRKMGVKFTLGRFHREIFLNSYLLAPSYINKMDDEFWSCFLGLRSTGAFSFQENESPSSQEAREIVKRLRSTKSSIFQVIRNYILLEIYARGSDNLGSLEVKWPVALPWSELISRAAEAFRYIYKINYMLYKFSGPAQDPWQFQLPPRMGGPEAPR
jgi:hypothetical protein